MPRLGVAVELGAEPLDDRAGLPDRWDRLVGDLDVEDRPAGVRLPLVGEAVAHFLGADKQAAVVVEFGAAFGTRSVFYPGEIRFVGAAVHVASRSVF